MTQSDQSNTRCVRCGHPLEGTTWYRFGDEDARHADCQGARVYQLTQAIGHIWEMTGCIREDRAPEVVSEVHDIAQAVR